jgi:hypothetical protein
MRGATPTLPAAQPADTLTNVKPQGFSPAAFGERITLDLMKL